MQTRLQTHLSRSDTWAYALALPGILALAWEPARWLALTWCAPAYGSDGGWIALGVCALLCVSALSGRAPIDTRNRLAPWILLGCTAALRLAGQLLAVNTIGALALAIDVAAIAMLLDVSRRPFALSPTALGCLFALSLPLEHHGQRLFGHPLQLVAAQISHALLHPFFPDLTRKGVLLLHPEIALAVDLPCSGARGLAVFASIALAFWTCHRLSFARSLSLVTAVGAGALLANAARIVALFVAGVHGLPVIDEPWHSGLGAAALALGSMPMLAVFRSAPRRYPPTRWPRPIAIETNRFARPRFATQPALSLGGAIAVSVVGLAVVRVPAHPIDAIPLARDRALPTSLGEFSGSAVPLAPDEARFYAQWGGSADKRRYDNSEGGQHTALWVRTRSPLRHLHGPDLCLIGSGHEVTRIGVVAGPALGAQPGGPRQAMPSVLYRSVAPDGSIWRVEATFASDDGSYASSVSEVVWQWIAQPTSTWNLVERISPWELCEGETSPCTEFDRALFSSLDFAVPQQLASNEIPNPERNQP